MRDKLAVAEMFYSIQGEGATLGVPAVFLRLAGCNLMCGGHGTQNDKQLHGGATWRCDTIEVWMKGKAMKFEDIVGEMRHSSDDIFHMLCTGAHLVITGGEPLMQMAAVEEFIKYLDNYPDFDTDFFIEIETNGTIAPSKYLQQRIDQWNVSPKLANSGMPLDSRKNLQAINTLALCRNRGRNCIFKFVISRREDWLEVCETYLVKTQIVRHQVYLMPAVDSAEDYSKMAQRVIGICKEECVNFSPREHIAVWNQKTGV